LPAASPRILENPTLGSGRGHDERVLERHELVGRETETGAAQAWVDLLGGGPAALVVRGEAGIGKSSLWMAAAELARAAGALVLVSRPVEAEMPLGYAGLGDLLEPVADRVLAGLPEPFAADLASALLLRDSSRPSDPLVVARATLAGLRGLAAASPVVVAVDDGHWLDPASARALAFATRRLSDERIGVLIALRDGHPDPFDCPAAFGERALQVSVPGLSLGATAHLLRTRVDPQTARRTVQKIHQQSGGNPFYSLHLARAPDPDGLPSSLRGVIESRLVAADPVARPALERAAVVGPAPGSTYDDAGALAAAVAAGLLVEDRDEVRFAHPLLATATYARITPSRRRDLHRRAADASHGAEERARHLALAATGADPATATLLEEAARVAGARGAPEAAAELAGHAARLTPSGDVPSRLRRLTDAADHLVRAGDEPAAAALAEQVLAGGATGPVRARALVHSALLASDARTAVTGLEQAAGEPGVDGLLAAQTLAQLAWQRGAWLGDVATAFTESVAAVALAEPLGDDPTLVVALTTAGLMGSIAGEPAAEGYLRRALEVADRAPEAGVDRPPRIAYAALLRWRGDWAGAGALLAAERHSAERRGDEGLLMRLDVFGAELALRRGRWEEADGLLVAALGDARGYWRVMALVQRAFLRGRRGDPDAATDAAEIAASPFARADPVVAASADHALGLLAAARRDVTAAADLLARLPRHIDGAGARAADLLAVVPEAVAALVEAGRQDQAATLTAQLDRRREQFAPWGPAAAELCHGLVLGGAGDTTAALGHLAAARAGLEAVGAPWELGQALLAEGSALRRVGRRNDAATVLDRAVDVFDALGAGPARDRARDELSRARPRPRSTDGPTAAERRVAALVSTGLTNKEVAAQLFTSVATVEAHLTRLYGKVGVRSRTQLARLVADGLLDVEPEPTVG
jgi:DNA-binding CsgD family transcriptional regulator